MKNALEIFVNFVFRKILKRVPLQYEIKQCIVLLLTNVILHLNAKSNDMINANGILLQPTVS